MRYRSEEREAELLTHPIACGRHLYLNAATEPNGWIRVSATDSWGNTISGLSHEECVPITGDALRYKVAWNSGASIPSSSEPIRLRIRSKRASLYAFYLDDV